MDFNLSEVQYNQMVFNTVEKFRRKQDISIIISSLSLILGLIVFLSLTTAANCQVIREGEEGFREGKAFVPTFNVLGGESGVFVDGNIHETQTFFKTDNGSEVECEVLGKPSALCLSYFKRGYYSQVTCVGELNDQFHCGQTECQCYRGNWEGQQRDEKNRVLEPASMVLIDVPMELLVAELSIIETVVNTSYWVEIENKGGHYFVTTSSFGPFFIVFSKQGYVLKDVSSGYEHNVWKSKDYLNLAGEVKFFVLHIPDRKIIYQGHFMEEAFSPCDYFPDLASLSPFRVPSCYSPFQVFLWYLLWSSFLAIPILLAIACCGLIMNCIRKRQLQKIPAEYLHMAILISLIACCSGCQLTYQTVSTVTNCQTNSEGVTECFPNQIVTFSIPYTGAQVCINVQDSNNATISQIKITGKAFQSQRSYHNAYYSSDWWLAYQSRMRCAGTEACNGPDFVGDEPDPDYCDLTASDHTRMAYGQLTSTWCAGYPGQTTCGSGLGTAVHGCVYPDSCVFSCYALVPTNGWFQVASLNTPVYRTFLEVEFSNVKTELEIGVANPKTYNGVELRMISVSGNIPDQFPVDYNSVFTFKGKPKVGVASVKGIPEKGKIGDIQALTMDDADHEKFYYDTSLVTGPIISNDEARYEAVPSAVGINGQMGPYSDLPGMINGNLWENTPIALISNLTVGAPVLYGLTFSADFFVSFISVEVCPDLSSVTRGTGCYDCDAGFSFNITAKSFCKGGFAEVVSKSPDVLIFTTVISIGPEAEYIIYAKSSKKDVDNDICLVVGSTESCLPLVGVLNEVSSNYTQHVSNTTVGEDLNTGSEDHDCGSDPFSRMFNGCPKWWDYLVVIPVFSILGILGILLLLMVLYLLYLTLSTCCVYQQAKWAKKQKLKAMKERRDKKEEDKILDQIDNQKLPTDSQRKFLIDKGYTEEDIDALVSGLDILSDS